MDYLVHHLVQSSACRSPEKEALAHGDLRLSYNEVARQTAGLAHGLRNASLRKGDRIGIYLPPSAPLVVSIFGISKAGGVFVPINHLLFPEQVVHIANDCGMRVLITSSSRLNSIATIIKDIKCLEFIILVTDADFPAVHLPTHVFEELSQLTPPHYWTDVNIDRDLAAILYTSGSTGKPKGVMLSQSQIMAGSSIVSDYLEITDEDRILCVLPFSFDAGLNQIMTAFQQRGTAVLMSYVFPKQIVQILIKEHITGLAGVPTLWSQLAQPNSSLEQHKYPHLRYVTNTGGAMPQSVLAILRRALPTTKIFLMYGLTEAFRSTYLPPEELDRRPTSMGKAIPNTEILVIDEQGQPCEPGQVGELIHRGPTVSMGYWGKPELTSRVLRPNPFLPAELSGTEKVCYSGDLVKMDEEGFVYFVGRRDNMIKSSGYRISPTEIEEVLFQSDSLREAAVIGIPNEALGHSIKAFVVSRDGEILDSDKLLAFCKERMPGYMVPKELEIVEELPKTTNGKIDYPTLRQREMK